MIEPVGFNNNIEKCRFFSDQKQKKIEDIFKELDRMNRMYTTKNTSSITKKLDEMQKQYKVLGKNNQQYVELFKKTLISYNTSLKEYSEKFETLGDM